MTKFKMSVSHRERLIEELRADPELAAIHLREAFASLGHPEERAVGMLAIRDVAQAYGGLAKIAGEAGISREALYRALSPKGNPTLNTLLAVLGSVGMRLSVEPVEA
jgi:probable addiction module antidote protein